MRRPGGEFYEDVCVGGERKGTDRDFLEYQELGERVSLVRARLEKDNFFGPNRKLRIRDVCEILVIEDFPE